MWLQRDVTLRARPRGFHLVTDEITDAVPELRDVHVGLAHLFIRHTSAAQNRVASAAEPNSRMNTAVRSPPSAS